MILTEEQAKTKGCAIAGESGCSASDCLAWRWVEVNVADDAFIAAVKVAAEKIGDTTPSRTKAVREVIDNRAAYGLPTEPTRGYCGLAGVPHDLPKVYR